MTFCPINSPVWLFALKQNKWLQKASNHFLQIWEMCWRTKRMRFDRNSERYKSVFFYKYSIPVQTILQTRLYFQLTQETASRIHLLTTCLENLEQLTFQLQDSKAWLTTTQQQLNDTLNITDLQPENLSTVQAQIGLVERELLAKQGDFASVLSSSQKFLTSLENYNSAKVIFLPIYLSTLTLNSVITYIFFFYRRNTQLV